MNNRIGAGIAGFGAGSLNGLFGAGGGMVLAPLLGKLTNTDEKLLFPASVAILIPICATSLIFSNGLFDISFRQALPYLLGSVIGGIIASRYGRHIPVVWLHRVFGLLILWGGIQYLC